MSPSLAPARCTFVGRRRSSTNLSQVSPPPPESPACEPPPPPTRYMLYSRALHLIASLSGSHTLPSSSSSPSTPTSDDSLLPLSASAYKSTFDEKETRSWHVPQLNFRILLVLTLFPISTAIVVLSLRTLPITVTWPKNLSDLAQLGRELQAYESSGLWPMMHVLAVMSVSAVWKHAWSIPGSVLWNVLAGALFSPLFATLLLTFITSVGSVCSTLLAKPLAPFLTSMMPRALEMTRHALEGNIEATYPTEKPRHRSTSGAWIRLSILRLIGVVPWSGLNIASGVCGVPLLDCFLGAFIGTLPWNAVTCQIGDILQTVASTPTSPAVATRSETVQSLLTSREVIFKLIFLSCLSLSPILARNKLRSLVSDNKSSQDQRTTRWSRIWHATPKFPIPSRSPSRDFKSVEDLTLEKSGLHLETVSL